MRAKRNPTRAEREAMESFVALQRKWDAVPKFARTPPKARPSAAIPALTTPPGRETPHYPSLDTGYAGGTKPIQGRRYTGTKMLGVAVMHKSNSVPVFKGEDAIEIARMRRG